MIEKTTIYVQLLEEGVPTARPVLAELQAHGLYKIPLSPDYDPQDEVWEFLPESIVRCEMVTKCWAQPLLLAVEQVR